MKKVEAKARKKAEKMTKRPPFQRIIGTIKRIEPLVAGNAISGETFKLTAEDGNEYKLRFCDSWSRARKIAKNSRRFQHILPHFYGREGRLLLYRWVSGTELNKLKHAGNIDKEHYIALGRIYGEVHAVDETVSKRKAKQFFSWIVNGLLKKGIITKEDSRKLFRLYREKGDNVEHKVVLEAQDLAIQNFMVESDTGRILMLDEEGITHRLKGLGMHKSFTKFFDEEEKRWFLEGYNKVHSDDYFTKEYQDFLALVHYARDVWTKARTGRPYDKPLKNLREYLNKN